MSAPDLTFVGDNDIMNELRKRYDCFVFIAMKKNVNAQGLIIGYDQYHGTFTECAGLAGEAQVKMVMMKNRQTFPAKDH